MSRKRVCKLKEKIPTLPKHATPTPPPKLNLKDIKPKTTNQERIFQRFAEGQDLVLHGFPGTGKTFLSLYLALQAVSLGNAASVTIIRSTVPVRDIGFLKGTQEEKEAAYELPYIAICHELFGKAAAYQMLKAVGKIKFLSTSFLRGQTLTDTIIVVDEIQNMNWAELSTVITRIDDECRVIFSGDFRQTDFQTKKDKDGLMNFLEVLKNIDSFEMIEMSTEDIVRSGIVKKFIISATELGFL